MNGLLRLSRLGNLQQPKSCFRRTTADNHAATTLSSLGRRNVGTVNKESAAAAARRCFHYSGNRTTNIAGRHRNNGLGLYCYPSTRPRSLQAGPLVAYISGCSGLLGTTTTTAQPAYAQCELAYKANLRQDDAASASNALDVGIDGRIVEGGWRRFRRKVRRAWRVLRRLIKLAVTLAPVVAFYPILLLIHDRDPKEDAHDIILFRDGEDDDGDDNKSSKESDVSNHMLLRWYLRMCLQCVEWSGAAVIKLMQWAGSRPDLFGRDFCAVFSQLQDNTTPHHWRHTERVLEETFGPNWSDKIQLHEILGSGCIGQVYRGEVTLVNDDGDDDDGKRRKEKREPRKQKVAVKVLHPNVEEDIDADLDLMRFAVAALPYLPLGSFKRTIKWLDPEGVVEDFAGLLKLQLDLRNEAANLKRFNENFAGSDVVVFPKLVPEYAPSKNLMVETFCDGVPVLQYARRNHENPEALQGLCKAAIQAVCQMIFLDNFMHGDLHPGNVFISHDGKKFILFDVGIVAEYTERDHEVIVDILASFIRHDGVRAARFMMEDSNARLRAKAKSTAESSSSTSSTADADDADAAIDEEGFVEKIKAMADKASGSDYLMEHLGTYITAICNAAADHRVMLNPSFVSASLAVKVQEGIALALDPAVEIWRVAIPVIVESERRRGLVKSPLLSGALSRRLDGIPWVKNIIAQQRTTNSTAGSSEGRKQDGGVGVGKEK